MPGLSEFLQWVDSRQLRKAAVTNAPRDNTVMMLSALKLDSHFEAVVLGEECERAKPHPDPYVKGLQLLGLQPHEAIVIEDSPAGGGRGAAGAALQTGAGMGWLPVNQAVT
jgi:HAD superfamily hydrolase (TIGR01509 family)